MLGCAALTSMHNQNIVAVCSSHPARACHSAKGVPASKALIAPRILFWFWQKIIAANVPETLQGHTLAEVKQDPRTRLWLPGVCCFASTASGDVFLPPSCGLARRCSVSWRGDVVVCSWRRERPNCVSKPHRNVLCQRQSIGSGRSQPGPRVSSPDGFERASVACDGPTAASRRCRARSRRLEFLFV
ncbi:hypothetical protein IQ07DRAFT_50449 [Pyrenochaeta sp. DS3sAY3a]|nr:hypothetical protein IQ07DRAFT_50449 [Pyrenochaeta sp. DS3sAY3a]